MQTIQFVVLGVALGGIYALVAHGMVLIHRGSGIVNFAQGGLVMVGAYAYYELRVRAGIPTVAAVPLAIGVTSLVGVAFQLLVLRAMRTASATSRVIATLGLLLVLQALVSLLYKDEVLSVPAMLPTTSVTLLPDVTVGLDRLIIFVIAAAITAVLWAVYRYTHVGRVTAAVAENEAAASALGYSPSRVAAANWAAGSGLAGLAGILIAPITLLQSGSLSLLVVPALAAGLVSGFNSFGSALLAAVAIGVAQALAGEHISAPGWSDSIPFFVVIVLLVVRGQGLPVRSYVQERMPQVGSGRVRMAVLLPAVAIAIWLLLTTLSAEWALALSVTMAGAIVCLSVVVLTGYAGQLSLAQYVIAGAGALVAARVIADLGAPYLVGLVAAMAVGVVIGLLVGLPALRTRGVNLGIATFGLALVLYKLVLSNRSLSGGTDGVTVDTISIFGWDIDSLLYPERYAVVVVVALTLVCLAIANLRRGPIGRRLLAIRASERAAASLGVSVYASKLYAFVVAAAIAALGGAVLALSSATAVTAPFDVFASIYVVVVTVVGGVGQIGGALIGALLLDGGVVSLALRSVQSLDAWMPLIAGLYVLLVLASGGSGLYDMNRAAVVAVGRGLRRMIFRNRADREATPTALPAPSPPSRARSRGGDGGAGLAVRGLDVRFGGVQALRDVEIEVRPGQVHGLIGPNGAGKTTLIDAVTGFVKPAAGQVTLGGDAIDGWGPVRRARAGLARSFQSVELFDDLTVLENIAVGADPLRRRDYLGGLLRAPSMRLSAAAVRAIEEFSLGPHLDALPHELPFGERRLVAIARALATDPRTILLDEPAAGLDEAEAAELGRVIRWLAEEAGTAVLLVEHNLDMVLAVSDTVTVLAGGTPIYAGSPDGVRTDPAVAAAYLGDAEPTESPASNDLEGIR